MLRARKTGRGVATLSLHGRKRTFAPNWKTIMYIAKLNVITVYNDGNGRWGYSECRAVAMGRRGRTSGAIALPGLE